MTHRVISRGLVGRGYQEAWTPKVKVRAWG
jgi:hypothetical protein